MQKKRVTQLKSLVSIRRIWPCDFLHNGLHDVLPYMARGFIRNNIHFMLRHLVFDYWFNWINENKGAALVAVSISMCFAEFSALPKVNARPPCRFAARSRKPCRHFDSKNMTEFFLLCMLNLAPRLNYFVCEYESYTLYL